MSATFNGQTVGFILKERLGWDRQDVFPSAVELEHDCDRDNPYEVDGHVFYDRETVIYLPERTCRMTKIGGDKVLAGWWKCSECGPVYPPCKDEIANWALQRCPRCGAKVIKEDTCR